MKINEIRLETNESNGLSKIQMTKLDRVVCIAGPNGSGKSRLLKHIKLVLGTKTTKSQIVKFESEIDRIKDTIKRNTTSEQQRIEQKNNLIPGTPNYQVQVESIEKEIINFQKKNIEENSRIKDLMARINGVGIITDEPDEFSGSYNFIDFVPSNKQLTRYGQVLSDNQKSFLNNIINHKISNIENFNEQVFSIINQINHDYVFSKDTNSSATQQEKDELKNRWNKLVNNIKIFLNADLTYNKEPELFGLPLSGEILSVGQSILLQFCVVLTLQENKLDELVIFMDEPENHLHPEALIKVINGIINVIPHGQLWIATHSVHLLSNVESDSIWYMQNGEIFHHRKKRLNY